MDKKFLHHFLFLLLNIPLTICASNVELISGVAGVCTTDDGSTCTFVDVSPIGIDTLQTLLTTKNVIIEASDDINIDADFSWSANSLTLTADHDININAIMTATGTGSLSMTAENDATSTDPFIQTSADDVRMALSSIGRVRVRLESDDSGFTGRVDFTSSGSLTINSEAYTIINSLAELDAMAMSNSNVRYALGSDIDGSTQTSELGANNAIFQGVFNGLGHNIDGINISGANYDGLFAQLNAATVSNLGITNATVSSTNVYIGILAGYSTGATIFNVYTTGQVSSSYSASTYIGGLIGYLPSATETLFDNVFSTANVNLTHVSADISGGLVGHTYALSKPIIVNNSHTTGDVGDQANTNLGGLIGYSSGTQQIFVLSSYATGDINKNSVLASDDHIGGLIGQVFDKLIIDESFATGDVYGSDSVGGLIGLAASQSANELLTINNSYASGNVYADNSLATDYFGGLIGEIDAGAYTTISDSFSYGIVDSTTNYTGGLFGSVNASPTLNDVYWNSSDNSNAVGTSSVTISGDTGLTTTLFKSLANLSGLSGSYWSVPSSYYAYPVLIPLNSSVQMGAAIRPSIETSPATAIGKTVTVNATVNANTASTTIRFEYGTTDSYGQSVTLPNSQSGDTDVSVSLLLSGLAADTLYHYRAVAVYEGGASQINGADLTFTTAASSQIDVTIAAGVAGTYDKTVDVCTFDDDESVGTNTIASAYADGCTEVVIRTAPQNSVFVSGSGSLDFNDDFTLTGNQKLTLISDNDLNINATLTASDSSIVHLTANNDQDNDLEPFTQTTADDNRAALATIGRVRVSLEDDGSGFKGNIDFIGRTGNGILFIDHDGDGVAEDYNLVASLADIDAIPDTEADDADQRIALSTNIDATGMPASAGTAFFGTANTAFIGVFDGLGHSIDGYTISGNGYDSFFGTTSSSSLIRNVGFNDIEITSSNAYAGAITSSSTGLTLHNVYATGVITGTGTNSRYYGGLVGNLTLTTGNAVVEEAFADVTISTATTNALGAIGGLVGYANESSNHLIIYKAHAKGDVDISASGDEIGGFIGGTTSNSANSLVILDSYATGDVNSSAPNGDTDKVGGFIGEVNGQLTIDNAFATGDVYGNDNVGGFIGAALTQNSAANSLSINNSYASGDVIGFDSDAADDVGGYIGEIDGGAHTELSNVFAYGTVTDETGYSGGLFGSINAAPSLTNVYWNASNNTNISGTSNNSTLLTALNTSSTGLTTSEFASLSNLTGFSGSYWAVPNTNHAYPVLSSLNNDLQTGFAIRPTIITNAATGVGKVATLNATVNANTALTTIRFDYGPTIDYGESITLATTQSGTSDVALSQLLSGLTANTLYHFRAVAVYANGASQIYGQDYTFTTDAASQIDVSIVSGSAGNYDQSVDICTFDDDSVIGVSTISDAYAGGCTEVVIRTGPENSDLVVGGGNINFDSSFTLSGTQKLTLIADRELSINATITADDSSLVELTANNYTADDADPFAEVDVATVRSALSSIGRLRMTRNETDTAFAGKVEFGSRVGNGFLTINGEAYTVINALTDTTSGVSGVVDLDEGPSGDGDLAYNDSTIRYALGTDINNTDTFVAAVVGGGTQTNYFSGILDGLGHEISNLKLTNSETYNGLFTSLSSATVRNIALIDASTTSYDSGKLGFIAGISSGNNLLHNIYISGVYSGSGSHSGGVVGYGAGQDILDSVSSNVNVYSGGAGSLGGLVGYATQPKIIINSHTSGNIDSPSLNLGGFIGNITGGNTHFILDSYSQSDINSNVTFLTTNVGAGGFIGNITTGEQVFVDNAFVTGDVYGHGDVGGIVGSVLLTAKLNLNDVYFSGNVLTPTESGLQYTGGLVGELATGTNLTISNSFTYGKAINSDSDYAGGIVGSVVAGTLTVNNVFYNSDQNALAAGNGTISGEASATNSEFSQASMATTLGTSRWLFDENYAFPILKDLPLLPQHLAAYKANIINVAITSGSAGTANVIEGVSIFENDATVGADIINTALASGPVIVKTGGNTFDSEGELGDLTIDSEISLTQGLLTLSAHRDVLVNNLVTINNDAKLHIYTDEYTHDYGELLDLDNDLTANTLIMEGKGRFRTPIKSDDSAFEGKIDITKMGFGAIAIDGEWFEVIDDISKIESSGSAIYERYALGTDLGTLGSDTSYTMPYNGIVYGRLDGLGHSINSFVVNSTRTTGSVAFFYRSDGATFRNLHLNDLSVEVDTGASVGGLVGHAIETLAHNLLLSGRVENGDMRIGGLFGYVTSSGTNDAVLIDSVVTAIDVVSTLDEPNWSANAGGLVGLGPAFIYNSHVTGDVYAKGHAIGGLAGGSYPIQIANSYMTGDVNPDQNHTNGTFTVGYVGGLVGFTTSIQVQDSFSTGNVFGGSRVGGIVGYVWDDGYTEAQGNVGTFKNVYSTGNIASGFSGAPGHTGGIIGSVAHQSAAPLTLTISQAFATGSITSVDTGPTTGGIIGGINNNATNGIITNPALVASKLAIENLFWRDQSHPSGGGNNLCVIGGGICGTDNGTYANDTESSSTVSQVRPLTEAQFADIQSVLDATTSPDTTLETLLSNYVETASGEHPFLPFFLEQTATPPVANNDSATVDESSNVIINIRSNDTDSVVATESLTITNLGTATNGTLINNNDGTVTYTHDGSETTVDSFTYTINNGAEDSAPATVSITITPVNDAPAITSTATTTATEDTLYSYSAVVADPDDVNNGSELTWSLSNEPLGMTVSSTGVVTWTPSEGVLSSGAVTLTVTDGGTESDTEIFTVVVTAVNDEPTITSTAVTTATEDRLYIYTATVIDPDDNNDGTALRWSLTNAPTGMTVSNIGVVTWTPTEGVTTSGVITLTVTDGHSALDSQIFTVAVIVANDSPIANNDSASVAEGQAVIIDLRDNDSDAETDNSGLTITNLSATTNGTLVNNNNGTVTYAHDGSETTADSFTYTINDGEIDSAPATVSIVVTSVNDMPVANNDMGNVAEGGTMIINLSDNDSDAETANNSLIITNLSSATHGDLVNNNDGTVTYTHNSSESTSDSFTYSINDGEIDSLPAVVTISITAVNDAPTISSTAGSLATEDTPYHYVATVIDADDSNDGSALIWSLVNEPAGMLVSNVGVVSWTPTEGELTSGAVMLTVTDGDGAFDSQLIIISVMAINDAPVAYDDSQSVAEGATVIINLRDNDTDVETTNSSLTITNLSLATNGSIENNNDGTVTYTHDGSETIADSFTYTVNDGDADSAPAMVLITVNAVNDIPIANDDNTEVGEGGVVIIDLRSNDEDVETDNTSLMVSNISLPANGIVVNNSDGTVTYTHDGSESTADSFTYSVNDGVIDSIPAVVRIAISQQNDNPVAQDDSAIVDEDNSIVIDILANDSDAENSLNTAGVMITTSPTHGQLLVSPSTGKVTYTPVENYFGNDSFNYQVNDHQNASSNEAVVSIIVNSVNDLPQAVSDVLVTDEEVAIINQSLIANDSDVDGTIDLSSVVITQNPSHATSFSINDGELNYTPEADYAGNDSLQYTVNDNTGATSVTTIVYITIVDVNDAPVALNDSTTMDEDTVTIIDVLDNDSDIEDGTPDSSTVEIVIPPEHGVATVDAVTGTITYAPEADYFGADYFDYLVKDLGNALLDPAEPPINSNDARVLLTITSIDDAPIATNDIIDLPEGQVVSLNILGNDYDKDGQIDLSTVNITEQPAQGSVSVDAVTGWVTYTGVTGYAGSTNFTYTFNDNAGNSSNAATVTLHMSAVNDAPVITSSAPTTGTEDVTYRYTASVTDPDDLNNGSDLTWSLSNEPAGMLVSSTGTVTWTPIEGEINSGMVTLFVADGGEDSALAASEDFSINVTPVNDGPIITSTAGVMATEDILFSYTATVADPDDANNGTDLRWSLNNAPAGMAVSSTGYVSWTPGNNVTTSGTVTLMVEDGQEDGAVVATESFTLSVTSINDFPVANNDSDTVAEGGTVIINLRDNDSDAETGNASLTITNLSSANNGTVVDNNDGTVTYQHNGSETLTDSFSYTINDGLVDSASAIVTIAITAVNDLPIANNDSGTVAEGGTVNINLRANDTDAETTNNSLTVTNISVALNGDVINNNNGTITYTHDGSETSSDSFTYRINDGVSDSLLATVSINVSATNDAPNITSTATSTATEDLLYTYIATASDDDNNDAQLTWNLTNAPSGMSISSTGVITWAPTEGVATSGAVSLNVTDSAGASDTEIFIIDVTAVNDAPRITSTATNSATVDTLYRYEATVNDPDDSNNGIELRWLLSNAPTGMSVSDTGIVTWTPSKGVSTSGAVTLTVTDGDNASDSQVFVVAVSATNDGPSITSTAGSSATEDLLYTYNSTVIDANDSNDGTALTWHLSNEPPGMSVSNFGLVSWIPTEGVTTSGEVTLTVTDSQGAWDSESFTIAVTAVNDAPVSDNVSYSLEKNSDIAITLSASDSDGDVLNYQLVTEPENGSLIGISPDLTYVPNAGFTGSDLFTFKVSDGLVFSNSATVTLVINETNNDPNAVDDFIYVVKNSVNNVVNILSNDSDIDSDQLTVVGATANFGSVTIINGNSLKYTPLSDSLTTDFIDYQVTDGQGGTSDATVTVFIEEADNLPPIALSDDFTLYSFDDVLFDVLSNDYDPEGDDITLINAQATSGEVAISEGQLIFTPEQNVSGTISIIYTIKDAIGNVASASVTVTIESMDSPTITLPPDLCDAHVVQSTALYTRVELGEASAVDYLGNTVPVSLIDGVSLYPPGLNQAFWQATDSHGNTSIEAQLICVMPLISIEKDKRVTEGEAVSVSIYLNGESPTYPVVIPFEVIGHQDDHTLGSGEVVLASGTEATLLFSIIEDGLNEEDEVVEISLAGSLNLGAKSEHLLTITPSNIAPEVNLEVMQGNQKTFTVSQTGGIVTINANVYDPNVQDTITYTWQVLDDAITNSTDDDTLFSFNPALLTTGIYKMSLDVSDDAEQQGTDHATVYFEVVKELLALTSADSDGDLIPDNIEGYQDSDGDGISDYLDRTSECNVLPQKSLVNDAYMLEGQSGICLRRGDSTLRGESGGAQITEDDVRAAVAGLITEDTEATNIGGIFDYIAYGLPERGASFAITIAQRKPIPSNAVYRKFREESGWGFFIEDDKNSLWSTEGEPGYCPPPNTALINNIWTQGLSEGHWCVQQIIEDGGVNDDDNKVNGTVIDPGGVGVMRTSNHLPKAVDDMIYALINTEVTIDVLNNDTDEDSDTLTISSAVASLGNVSIINGKLLYQPMTDYLGIVTINYGVTDNNGGTDHAVVYITTKLNSAPEVQNEESTVAVGGSVALNLLRNDTDPEGGGLSLLSVNNSQVSFESNGDAIFSADNSFIGVVIINYTVQDGEGNTAIGEWVVTVEEPVKVNAKTSGGALYLSLLILLMSVTIIRQYKIRRK